MNLPLRPMKRKPDTRVFKIEPEKIANPLMRVGVGLTRGLIEHTLCFPQLNKIYDDTADLSGDTSLSFARRALQSMNVTWRVNALCDQPLPAEGPVVVVANHPYGGIEGVLLLAMIESYRTDIKVMANYLLASMPQARCTGTSKPASQPYPSAAARASAQAQGSQGRNPGHKPRRASPATAP